MFTMKHGIEKPFPITVYKDGEPLFSVDLPEWSSDDKTLDDVMRYKTNEKFVTNIAMLVGGANAYFEKAFANLQR